MKIPIKIRILHLEDVPGDALLISQTLKGRGGEFEFLVVDTKEKFKSGLEGFSPNIVLADDSVPSFDSGEALEIMKSLGVKVPFILVSAAMTDELVVDIIKKGATDYIFKDRLGRLPVAIHNALEKFQLERERQGYLDQLTNKELKFRRLIENGADAVVILTPEGKASYVSPTVEKILGYTPYEAIKLDMYDLIHPDEREAAAEDMAECISKPGATIYGRPLRTRHKDGSWRWLEATLVNLLHDPVINGIVDNFRDVTQRILSEKMIIENEEKYRSFFENSLDGILLTAPTGEIFAANPAACEIFQMSEEEICKAGRTALVDITDKRFSEAIVERRKTGKVKTEFTMIRKDGSKFPAEISSSIFRDANGNERTSIIIRDISERKRGEEELQSSQENYKKMFHNSPLPNWIFDEDTLNIVDVNAAAIAHYGYTREEFLQLNLVDLRPKEEIPRLREDIAKSRIESGVSFGKFVHLKKDGTRITVEIYGYRIRFENANCRFIVCIDISEKEAVLQKLEENRQKLLAAQKIAKMGYWEQDLENSWIYWTDEVYNIWGQEKETFEPNSKNFLKTIHPEDIDYFKKEQEAALTGSKDWNMEHRILLPNGQIKWVHEKGKLAKDKSGNNVIFTGTVQDITERKEAVQKLMQSEARHLGILKSQTNYLTRTDLTGTYTYCNEKFLKDFSWAFPQHEVVGERAEATVQKYHLERVLKTFQDCVENPNQVFQVEIDKIQQDGGVTTTLWDFICLTNADGNPMEIQCVGIDITDRVKAEKSLKESINRYELVSKATSDAIWDWNLETDELFWGSGFETLFGYKTDSVNHVSSWENYVHPEDRQRVTKSLQDTINGTGTKWSSEYRFKRLNGEYAHVVDQGFIIRDAHKNAVRLVGALQDISAQKAAIQKLMLSEARHRGLIQSQTNYVMRVNLEGDYVYCNDKFMDDFGWIYPDNVVLGSSTLSSIKEYHYDRVKEVSMKCLENPNTVYQVEIDKPAKGEGVKTTLWDFICLTNAQGEPEEIQCVGIDITDWVKAEDDNRFQAELLDKIGQAVVATNMDGTVNYWNKAATAIYGWTKEEAVGKDINDLTPSLQLREQTAQMIKALKQGRTWSGEFWVKRKDGSEFPALVTDSPIHDENQELKHIVGISSDITERKNAENQLLELNKSLKEYTEELVTANKGLEQFSFIVSHNLRSPVANILGLADLMEREEYPAEVKEKLLGEVFDNIKRLDAVISDLNEILKIKGELAAKKEVVDLSALVNSIQAGIHHLIEKDEVEIQTNFANAPNFHTVGSYLHSIFSNLIANSIKYKKPGAPPHIEITSEEKDGQLIINFRDNGLGIDLPKRKEEIFGLYKRFHHHVEGKGMGLFMVKTQVEMLGGKISVSSEVDKGTEFVMEFKIDNEPNFENEEPTAVHGR